MASCRASRRLSRQHRVNYCELHPQIKHELQQNTLCHYINTNRSLLHQYVLTTSVGHDEHGEQELYGVIEVDPRASSLRIFTMEERGNPKGILPRKQLVPLTSLAIDNSWSVLRVHYLERSVQQIACAELKRGHVQAFKAECKQVLYNLGHTVHTSMNNKMFIRECKLIRNERMSLNVFEAVVVASVQDL